MDIYLILGGENIKKRPRSKYLLNLLKNPKLNWKTLKIICSGKSYFDNYTYTTEAQKMKIFLTKNNIPKENIIEENESMDTLGNMYFSYQIIEKLILQKQNNTIIPKKYPKITIHLITEKFHLNRSKELFLQLFGTLKGINPTIKFKYHKIKETNILSILNKTTRTIKETAIITGLLSDIIQYNLQLPEQFKNYLYSLPIYKDIYHGKMNLTTSIYKKAIEQLLKSRKNN